MNGERKKKTPDGFDISRIDFVPIFNRLDEGVIITDRKGVVRFYNSTQGEIDSIDPKKALGLNILELYDLTEETSMIMQCMKQKKAIRNRMFFYRTRFGKVANTIHSIFPFFENGQVSGAICFIKDYSILRQSTSLISVPSHRPDHGNGTRFTFADLIGDSPEFRKVVKSARDASHSASPIMLFGETGTGKELFAQSIHNYSPRKKQSYVAVNCSAIPESLLEGLLFGTARGAFTGAIDKPGLFEQANGGTLFLDELLSMPCALQAKLLRVIQEKRVRRVGSLVETELDLKIISSVSEEPRRAVHKGILRTDLFYRLGVVIIKIPSLRERAADLPDLCRHFVLKLNPLLGTHVRNVSPQVMELFKGYAWPGNIRELEHLIEGAMNLAEQEKVIGTHHLAPGFEVAYDHDVGEERSGGPERPEPGSGRGEGGAVSLSPGGDERPGNLFKTQKEEEKRAIGKALGQSSGNITKAAAILGISRQLLHYKMKKFRLSRSDYTSPAGTG